MSQFQQPPFNQPPQQQPPYMQSGMYQQPVPPPATPQPQQQPIKSSARKSPRQPWKPWQFVLLGLIVGAIIGYAAHTAPSQPATSATQQSTTQATSQPTAPPTQAPTPKPTNALKWTTVQTFTGNGDKKTAIFDAPGDWKILYTCTYQNLSGVTADGSFALSVYGADGSVVDPAAIDATCKNGVAKSTGETEEHQAGQVYLSVYATGDWTVQIQQLK